MSPLLSGLISGLIFGAIDIGLMLPMSFPDKKTALLGAFCSRFAIGLVIPLIQLPSWPGWLIGVTFGLLISLPDAIITKAVRSNSYCWSDWRCNHRRPNPWLEGLAPRFARTCYFDGGLRRIVYGVGDGSNRLPVYRATGRLDMSF